MITITKEFAMCYGHRVWTQTLDTTLTENNDSTCACKHLHGHNAKILVTLRSTTNTLNKSGMVTDFKHLGWFKSFLDENFDHKFIFDINDPLLKSKTYTELFSEGDVAWNDRGFGTLKHVVGEYSESEYEMLEGLVFVKFPPTSELLSEFFASIIDERMKHLNVEVDRIVFFETDKSQSTYIKQ